jgi:hypothetical protein
MKIGPLFPDFRKQRSYDVISKLSTFGRASQFGTDDPAKNMVQSTNGAAEQPRIPTYKLSLAKGRK